EVPMDHRQAHNRNYGERPRRLDDLRERIAARVEQRLLLKEILAGIPGEPQLGEDREHRFVPGGLAHQGDGLLSIKCWVGNAHGRDAHGHASKVVAVDVKEVTGVRCHKETEAGNSIPTASVPYLFAARLATQ